jgi:predicted ATPase
VLRSFRLGNHRSFRDEQELLLMPVYADDRPVLPVTAVYGANASGKSNLLDALRFMTAAVRDSFGVWSPGKGVPRRPFKLDVESRMKPSTFVVELLLDGIRYTYGFEVDDDHVLAEWLYSYPEKRKRVLFERLEDRMKFGAFAAKELARLELMNTLLRPNALFLSLAAQFNATILMRVYHWFVDGVVFGAGDVVAGLEGRVADFVRANPGQEDRMVELLSAADLGVTGLVIGEGQKVEEVALLSAERELERSRAEVDKARSNLEILERRISPESAGDAHLILRGRLGEQVLRAEREFATAHAVVTDRRAAVDRERQRVRLLHGGSAEPFQLDDESSGTLSWLSLLPVALTVLLDGGVLVVDEIDESLHSLLSARLIALFNDVETNVAGGQLIFTTHDATLLHPPLADKVLSRDEVWFVEKDGSGASTLYPLTDFKPRREDNLERRYLAGQYGAVPNVYGELFAEAVRGEAVDGEA